MQSAFPGSLKLTAVLVLLFVASTGMAHQQWLVPNVFLSSGDSVWVTFDHTFGDQRFRPASGPGSYYNWWIVGPDGLRQSVASIYIGKTRTVGEVELEEQGTYRLEGVESMSWSKVMIDGEAKWQPGTREDYADYEVEVSRYYFQKAVSYVTLGSVSESALTATGEPLEIVFADHPNEWRQGKDLKVKVLASGKPLTGQEVKMFTESTEGHDAESTCKTDSKGVCSIAPPAGGRILLVTNAEGDSPRPVGTDSYYHSVSVLLELAKPSTD